MARLKILMAPDERLRTVAQKVEKVDSSIQKKLDDMAETMYLANGIGLAATQVDIHERLVVIDIEYSEDAKGKNTLFFVNPELVKTSKETSLYQEGCLSLPNAFDEVMRPATCTVKALDYNGQEFTLECEGLLATCIQHEIDHLDGILFADHLSRLKKDRMLTKLRKSKKRKEYSAEVFKYD